MPRQSRRFQKVLIANRGEIAVRIIRACHELNIPTVAIFSDADRHALHVRYASEAYHVGEAPSDRSYLRVDRILDIARRSGADAVHPGYGFLSENADFAQQLTDAGLCWIGPSPAAIRAMGSKTESRARMDAAGVPVVPGVLEAIETLEEAREIAEDLGYPVMLKAAAGGGGKGMRRVEAADELASAFRSARSEAASFFGDDTVYIEKLVVRPRHVEVQVLADQHGNVVHLFERECSIQRRHQKVVEESPCPVLDPDTRQQMAEVAIRAARAVDYVGAGTVEFLYAPSGEFYFLEMNTRLQVEHPITELVTGIDLVQAQLRVAMGEPLSFSQESIEQRGHAFEFRIYAEDPSANWAPSPGKITGYREPGGPWVRVDGAVYQGAEVSIYYDPMIAKLVIWGTDREQALNRAGRALREFRIRGIQTSLPFFRSLVEDPDFRSGATHIEFLDAERMRQLICTSRNDDVAVIAAAIAALKRDSRLARPVTAQANQSRWKWSLR